MKTVIIASTNPVKIEVAKRAFDALYPAQDFEFISFTAKSGVPDQPFEEETLCGAKGRLEDAKRRYPEADFWIGQEGGLFADGDMLYNAAWIVIHNIHGSEGKSQTGRLYIPRELARLVRKGKELGHAGDEVFWC
jgi:inosine/xanthosine triphosphatase